MHNEDDEQGMPDPDERPGARAARRAVVFEESLRAATAFMAVVFSVSVITVFPFVPAWVFPAALGGVVLSVPAAISVRIRLLRPEETRSMTALWNSALVGVATVGLVLTLLAVIARMSALGPALTRLGTVLAAVALIAYIRGWRPLEVEQHPQDPVLDDQMEPPEDQP